MTDGISVEIRGIDEMRRALDAMPERIRKRALMTALRKAAAVVRTAAREATPVLQTPVPYRTKGLLRRKISVRVSKADKAAGNVGVFVNVRPAKGAEIGARNPRDPYYWRFVNNGTRRNPGKRFLQAGAAALPRALEIFELEMIPAIERLNGPSS